MTQEDITRLAREAGFVGMDGEHGALRRLAALVAAAEREACAKACDELAELNRQNPDDALWQWEECAAAIRNRSNT